MIHIKLNTKFKMNILIKILMYQTFLRSKTRLLESYKADHCYYEIVNHDHSEKQCNRQQFHQLGQAQDAHSAGAPCRCK